MGSQDYREVRKKNRVIIEKQLNSFSFFSEKTDITVFSALFQPMIATRREELSISKAFISRLMSYDFNTKKHISDETTAIVP